jgi:hypothetical protein
MLDSEELMVFSEVKVSFVRWSTIFLPEEHGLHFLHVPACTVVPEEGRLAKAG